MKRTLIIITMIAAACQFGLRAATPTSDTEPEGYQYQPLVREGVEWKYTWKLSGIYGKNGGYFMQLSGDTIVNGKEYKVCYRYSTPMFYGKEKSSIVAFMREEDKKVYAILFESVDFFDFDHFSVYDSEYMIYDFNLSVGDETCTGVCDEQSYGRVSKVVYAYIGDRWRKAIYIENILWTIEGIGTVPESAPSFLPDPVWNYAAPHPGYYNTLQYVKDDEGYGGHFHFREDTFDLPGYDDSGVTSTAAESGQMGVTAGDGSLTATAPTGGYERAELTDAMGRRVAEAAVADGVARFDGVDSGVYVVTLVSPQGSISRKVAVH